MACQFDNRKFERLLDACRKLSVENYGGMHSGSRFEEFESLGLITLEPGGKKLVKHSSNVQIRFGRLNHLPRKGNPRAEPNQENSGALHGGQC